MDSSRVCYHWAMRGTSGFSILKPPWKSSVFSNHFPCQPSGYSTWPSEVKEQERSGKQTNKQTNKNPTTKEEPRALKSGQEKDHKKGLTFLRYFPTLGHRTRLIILSLDTHLLGVWTVLGPHLLLQLSSIVTAALLIGLLSCWGEMLGPTLTPGRRRVENKRGGYS